MPDRLSCRVENLTVRPEVRETVEDLVYKLFERRHHHFVAGQEQDWLTVELVQSIRRESTIYREELSTEMAGPIPFALGYFQLRDGGLKLTTEKIPANMDPESFVRFLSEFVEAGGRLWVGSEGDEEGWEIQGPDDVVPIESGPASG
ncbi:hypothetical protein BSZ35_05700 [Salinibacter sp. 10B]|uniref:hypothetical protein n=1 Tax=Salinibacter sp. 10B TaxID=1923971 RepID=UPI000CF5238B|nr:hypothetical protein [Salinibacter sp. 10B]PQJ34164.1 hypothetical protein BSZ35_05700 [Salinibacter sp. 10B]